MMYYYRNYPFKFGEAGLLPILYGGVENLIRDLRFRCATNGFLKDLPCPATRGERKRQNQTFDNIKALEEIRRPGCKVCPFEEALANLKEALERSTLKETLPDLLPTLIIASVEVRM